MCGIFCTIGQKCNLEEDIPANIKNLLHRRGPDASCTIQRHAMAKSITFGGFVLWQQGDELCHQPYECDTGDILLLNGDIFDGLNSETNKSDTEQLGQLLSSYVDDSNNSLSCAFRHLRGPFSMIFYCKKQNILYFARDSLGRNSLLLENNVNQSQLTLLSTSYFDTNYETRTFELPPLGLYKLNINNHNEITIYPWLSLSVADLKFYGDFFQNNFNLRLVPETPINSEWLHVERTFGDDLSFDFYDLIKSYKGAPIHTIIENLLLSHQLSTKLDKFGERLQKSVKDRVLRTPKLCQECIKGAVNQTCHHSKICILFSGGIDCTILALLADTVVPREDSIDLINVAFERVNKTEENDWNVPDRLSALESIQELKTLCPNRKWNFVQVNITRDELNSALHTHIKHLIYPLNTVLDESIGCAFWFASRGQGEIDGELYKSPARIALIGSGADELFGGYMRHRNAFVRFNGSEMEKNENVRIELEKDWLRIPSRNLARDDRIISDNGRTARAPFIEENVVQFVRNLEANQRCCFLLKEGVGDKLFLRLYGYKLGLRNVVALKKRAIQFGTRLANKKQNAQDMSNYLKFNYNYNNNDNKLKLDT